LRFVLWLLLGLEFELAADVVGTAISPTWQSIGAIRSLLSYFLEEDIDKDALNEGKPGEGGRRSRRTFRARDAEETRR
jgi:uncharacterized membrane protein